MLISLLCIFIISILVFTGDRGAKSIVTTALHGCLLFTAIFLMYFGAAPIFVTAVTCLAISAVTMFYQNEGNQKSRIAFAAVATVILVLIPIVFWFADAANAEGFNQAQYEITDTNGYTRNVGINMLQLQISVMLIALIGTVIDIAIAITSSIYEIQDSIDTLTFGELIEIGFTSGRAILNTSIHTIFYVYIAEYLTLMIQYVDEYTFERLINSQSFSAEFITVSISGIGCCLVVPATTLLCAWRLSKGKETPLQ